MPLKFKRVLNAKDFKQMASNHKTGETPPLEFDSPRGLTFINEAGLYRLAMRSNLPKAEEFTDWVCDVVLVSIRKTGYYSLVADPKPVVKLPDPKRSAGQHSDACVYVFDFGNSTVKLGQSNDVDRRKPEVKRDTGLEIVNVYHTPFMPRKFARLIEQACKKFFAPRSMEGEIFSVPFDEACAVIDLLVQHTVTLTSSKNSIVVTDVTNLIADKKFD